VQSLKDIIRQPIIANFIKYIERSKIPKCPITKAEVMPAEDIFGNNIGSLQ